MGTSQKSDALCADILLKLGAEGIRKLRVFESGKLSFETEDAALCTSCGGVAGDPFQGIKWNGSTLSVSNAGGSREAWDETWKFAKRDNRWVIVGWDRNISDQATGSTWLESVNALSGKAEARHKPGEGECPVSSKDNCKKSAPIKEEKLACAHPAKSPAAGSVKQWREKGFACGLKTP
jgi:hypothetical protein